MAGSGKAHLRAAADPVLTVEDLVVAYEDQLGAKVSAVAGVSFDILSGETLGLVGESGCGKSTTARAVLQLPRPTSGRVVFRGRDLSSLGERHLRAVRPKMQMVFQDPSSSLNPRRAVVRTVMDPLNVVHKRHASGADSEELSGGAGNRARAEAMLAEVGIDPASVGRRRPRELSGGQCQRVSIARALVTRPDLLLCDEAVSALDVSVQAQVLNLLEDIKDRYGLSMLFISHDLGVVKSISDRVIVMYLGKICEVAAPEVLYQRAAHPYSVTLMQAIPGERRPRHLQVVSGEPPSNANPPSGCRFRTRCPNAQELCASEEPAVRKLDDGHFVACHYPVAAPATIGTASVVSPAS